VQVYAMKGSDQVSEGMALEACDRLGRRGVWKLLEPASKDASPPVPRSEVQVEGVAFRQESQMRSKRSVRELAERLVDEEHPVSGTPSTPSSRRSSPKMSTENFMVQNLRSAEKALSRRRNWRS
jgi:hypothetical protein